VGLDEELFRALNGAGNPFLDPVAIALGVVGLAWIAALWALPVWFSGRRREAVDLLVLLALVEATVFVLKWSLAVPRPDLGVQLAIPFDDATDPAFPSGHATRAFAAAAFLAMRARSWRWGAPLLAYGLAVALSRVYAGVHWPSDVLAGTLLGLAWAYAFEGIRRRPAYVERRDRLVLWLRRGGEATPSPPGRT